MIKAIIILGEEAVKYYDETGNPPSDEWLMDNGGVVDEKEFNTQAEYNAYVQALSDASNWNDYQVIKQPDQETESEQSAEASLWIRLGVSVKGNREDIEKILQGDQNVLSRLISENKFQIDGEAYIPSSVIEEYNDEHGTDFEPDDIDFSLNIEQ